MIFKRRMRHVLVEASFKTNLADKSVETALRGGLRGIMGEANFFRANPRVTSQLSETVFIMSVNRGFERELVVGLSFMKELNHSKVGFYTIKTSGTIKSLKECFEKFYGIAK